MSSPNVCGPSLEEIFDRYHGLGCTEYASGGGGPWLVENGNEVRLMNISAFFHPDGNIFTFITWKSDEGQGIHRSRSEEGFSDLASFQTFCDKWKIKVYPRTDLKEACLQMQ